MGKTNRALKPLTRHQQILCQNPGLFQVYLSSSSQLLFVGGFQCTTRMAMAANTSTNATPPPPIPAKAAGPSPRPQWFQLSPYFLVLEEFRHC
jgi:hypothetical protein